MLVDTQPATHQHLPASPEVREEWVNSQLIGVVMDGAMTALLAAAGALPIMVYLMLGEVHPTVLALWAGTLAAVLFYRFRMIGQYRLRYDSVEGPMRMTFVSRYGWTWGAVGLLWGLSVAITFQQASAQTQFIVGVVILGHGMISLTSFSPYLPLLHQYTNALIGASIVGLVAPNLIGVAQAPNNQLVLVIVLLLLIFWWLLRTAGERLHQVHRASFELQFSNQELIDSLTQQTRAALRAVATKNRFLASAAHDLRQPVHALSLYADWLSSEPEMASDIAPRILQSTRAINELFDSLFDLTRIDAGNYKVRLQHVEVQQLFADVAMQFEPVAKSKSLEVAHPHPAHHDLGRSGGAAAHAGQPGVQRFAPYPGGRCAARPASPRRHAGVRSLGHRRGHCP